MYRWAILCLLVISCSPRVIQYNNPKSPYETFKTYALLAMKGDNMDVSSEVRDAIKRLEQYTKIEMSRRGYVLEMDDPDLILRYEVVSSTEVRTNYDQTSYSYGGFVTTSSAVQSVLLYEMINAETKKLVWQASMDLQDYDRNTRKKDAVQQAVQRIFNTYLYRALTNEPDPDLFIK